MTNIDPQSFWNDKIMSWEEDRYGSAKARRFFLESIASRASKSLRNRQSLAAAIIGHACQGKHVIEIGCGSGRLAASLIKAGASNYTGYDIAPSAIAAAEERKSDDGLGVNVSFSVADVRSMPILEADIVFSLGLFDWLSDEEISILFNKSRSANFIHSFSEKRASLSQWLHRLYVHLAYGHRTRGYVPRYQTYKELNAIAKPYFTKSIRVHRSRSLAFGAFLTTLPIEARVVVK